MDDAVTEELAKLYEQISRLGKTVDYLIVNSAQQLAMIKVLSGQVEALRSESTNG